MEVKEDMEIEVITDDDETLKTLGELLSNKTSRNLLKYLMHKEAYKMKISDESKIPFSLVEHHLKKMEKLGLVKITNKKIVKGGVLHKTYKITATGIFILLNHTNEEVKEKGTLKKIFKDGVKFTAIGFAGIISWISSQIILNGQSDKYGFVNDELPDTVINSNNVWVSIFFTTTIILIGFVLILIKKKKS